ncbi:MAG: ACT domain-containing protein [Blautia sp.]|nr:ACT domain-containing protein [Blautia sp.]
MENKNEQKIYYVVRERAVPEVLLKVVEAKKLLDSGKVLTVQEAAEQTGISRSSFYKYKDDIFPFHDETKGKKVTFVMTLSDAPGLLSLIFTTIAQCDGNILTAHQSVPINGVATLSLTVEILPGKGDAAQMMNKLEKIDRVQYLKVQGSD